MADRNRTRLCLTPAVLVLALYGFVYLQCAPALAQSSYSVSIFEQHWRDEQRQRELPIKLRLPVTRLATERFPVIVFCHGLGDGREAGGKWGEFWSMHGYIVVHVQHPGSDEALFDQRYSSAETSKALKQAATGKQLRERLSDIKFVLDEFHRRPEFRQADLTRIGMSGHSFGALTTQILAGQHANAKPPKHSDPRIKAAIAFSPSVRNRVDAETQFAEVNLPFMSVTGTLDKDGYGRGVTPDERIRPFYAMPVGHKFLVLFHNGDHAIFNGGASMTELTRLPEAIAEDVRITRLTQMLTLAFWDAYLQGMTTAQQWLETRAASALGPQDRFEQR